MSLDDFLKKIPSFSSVFNATDNSVLGIDIGSSSIKVIQMKKRGGHAVLETYGEIALGPYAGVEIGRATNLSADKLSVALADLIKESKVTSKNCGLSVSVGSSMVTFVKMPMLNEKQLMQMVPIEARKYIPVPVSEVTLDWWPIPKEEDFNQRMTRAEDISMNRSTEQMEILLAVIHNDAILKGKSILFGAGLDTSTFEIETFAAMRSVLEQGIISTIILDIGASTTKIYISERGVLRSSHIVNRGSQDITLAISASEAISVDEAENLKRKIGLSKDSKDKQIADTISLNIDFIISETNRIILNYQKNSNKQVSRVILSGGGSLLKGLPEFVSKSIGLPTDIANPFAKIETPAFFENVLRDAGPEFAVAIGIALRKLQEQ